MPIHLETAHSRHSTVPPIDLHIFLRVIYLDDGGEAQMNANRENFLMTDDVWWWCGGSGGILNFVMYLPFKADE